MPDKKKVLKSITPTQNTKQYWLMKSEPRVYSIQHLRKSGKDLWDGVRNHQAKNFMKHNMQIGDEVLFYHSNAQPSGIVGLARVSKTARPDPTAFDSRSPYYDPSSHRNNPRWFCVEVTFKACFKRILSLAELKAQKKLSRMLVLKKGQRLSVMPVTKKEYEHILVLSQLPKRSKLSKKD